ncbi:phosphate import ATP-binding protein PstB [Spirochaetota bacterium]|nr:phosphate import ATP-binding protein PstB [Spirochaetota bacterium]
MIETSTPNKLSNLNKKDPSQKQAAVFHKMKRLKPLSIRKPSIAKKRPQIKNISQQFSHAETILSITDLCVYFSATKVLKNININFPKKGLVAIMGPSGCGKSTLIRAINRMHELDQSTNVTGKLMLGNQDITTLPAMAVRQRIGMVFQRPNPFPNMTIFQNVLSGYILTGMRLNKKQKNEIVIENLKKAFLWDEVKDRLHERGTFLSGGQQQRLCIARSLAMQVDVLLLDEPTSALDPIATTRIENLLQTLKKEIPIIMVTHNTAQASRISDYTAFLYLGELIEYNKTKIMFTVPSDKRTEAYLMGRFG